MVKRQNNLRLRRALILVLFLLVPTLLYDLSALSRTGHGASGGGTAPATDAHPSVGTTPQALLPVEPGALHPGRGQRHWHTATGAGDDPDIARDELLRDLVYTHVSASGDDNKPLSDGGGDQDFSFGGGGGHGGGGFGGPSASGGPGYDPGTDFLPLAFTPDPGGGKGGDGGGNTPLLSPTIPSIAAVPEPATWALFILGFGLIGAQLRRARDAQPAPALTRPRNRRLG